MPAAAAAQDALPRRRQEVPGVPFVPTPQEDADCEIQFAAWRRWLDVFLVVLQLTGTQLPLTVFILQCSSCLHLQHNGHLLPFAPGVVTDSWLEGFPCASTSSLCVGLPSNIGSSTLSFSKMMAESEGQAMDWVYRRRWWAVPYVNLRYNPLGTAPFYVLSLAVLLLPWVTPGWWQAGGRTCAMAAFRLSAAGLPIIEGVLVPQRWRQVHTWDALQQPWRLLGALIVKRSVVAMVPWRWHWRVSLLEAPLVVLSWLARHTFHPPPGQLPPMLLAAAVSTAVSLTLNRLEMAITRQVFQWLPSVSQLSSPSQLAAQLLLCLVHLRMHLLPALVGCCGCAGRCAAALGRQLVGAVCSPCAVVTLYVAAVAAFWHLAAFALFAVQCGANCPEE